ncbi:hypothetical protein [Wukongibacter baidiensis]
MISNKYRILILIVVLIFSIKATAYGSSEDSIVEYDIKESSTDDFVNIQKTDLEIDTKEQVIKLSGEDAISKIKFSNEDNFPVAYSVMKGDEIVQYGFNGEKIVEIDNLKVEVENPFSYASKLSSLDLAIAIDRDEGEKDIMYYSYAEGSMIEVPFLSLNGLTDIRSMAFVNENNLAILEESKASVYKMSGDEMVYGYSIDNLDNPLDIASSNNHSVTVLEEEKIRQFEFNGSGYSEIPSLAINIDADTDVRAIDAGNGQITFIDNEKAYTYLMTDNEFAYVEALSVTDSLTAPCAVAVHKDKKDIIILDKEEDKTKIKYFSFTGDKMTEVPQLSIEVEDVLLGSSAKYALKGELISHPIDIEGSHVNLIQIGANSYLEENTSITFYISQGEESDNWMPLWKLKRGEGNISKLYRNTNFGDGNAVWDDKGDIDKIFPENLDLSQSVEEKDTEFEVVKDDDGNLQLNPPERTDDWFKLPTKSDMDSIRIRMKFESEDGETTPYVFVPYKGNEIQEIEEDDIAIKIIGRTELDGPVIDDIDDGLGNLPGLQRKKGWVYTTTPTIKWKLPNILENDNYQDSCQLVIMADTDGGWEPALITDKITGKAGESEEFQIPTSKNIRSEGPLFESGGYKFAVFVRVWDEEGNPSNFSTGKRFNVLAYERPRITNIVSTPDGEFSKTVMIEEEMGEKDLPLAKAGTAITFTIDSVGPIENDVNNDDEVSEIYFNRDDKKILLSKGEVTSEDSPESPVNTWDITFWTSASVLEVPEDTIIKIKLIGDSDEGGRTVFYIPDYADGITRISDTVYTEWNVFLKGRD